MTHVAFNPGRVAGADVGWMETVVPGIEEIAWALEAAEMAEHWGGSAVLETHFRELAGVKANPPFLTWDDLAGLPSD